MVLAVAALGGCGAIEAKAHGVGGEVHGLWNRSDGVALRLEADGVNTLLTVSANGSFSFPVALRAGASYTVTVATNPSSHTCTVGAGGNGTIADADVTAVLVGCTGPATSIELSGQWGWAFDPTQDVQQLSGSVVAQEVAFTVSGASLTGATVGGTAVTLGARSAPVRLQLGATTVMVALTASGGLSKTYQLVFDRGGAVLDQLVYGKASNPGSNDGFGYSVALSGDTLAVGAYFESSAAVGVNGDQANDTASRAGAVYVFVRSGKTWSQQAYLKASNTGAGDNFGRAVALSYDTLVVGATGEASAATGVGGNQADNSAPGAGAVYVFTRSGSTWSQQSYVKASNSEKADLFGTAVALSGETLAVGAFGEDSAATGVNGNQADNTASAAGAVYVFIRSSGTWTQQAYLKASNSGHDYEFGGSIAMAGDTLVVGASAENSGATGVGGNQSDGTAPGAGAAYVFARSGTTWEQRAYVKSSNTGSDDGFGSSLALSGDTLVIGAFGESSGAAGINPANGQADNTVSGAGAAYIFR